jgi:hypothetical protein
MQGRKGEVSVVVVKLRRGPRNVALISRLTTLWMSFVVAELSVDTQRIILHTRTALAKNEFVTPIFEHRQVHRAWGASVRVARSELRGGHKIAA